MEVELAEDFFLLLLGLVSGSLSWLSDLVTGADACKIQSKNVTISLLVINILQHTVNKHALDYTTFTFFNCITNCLMKHPKKCSGHISLQEKKERQKIQTPVDLCVLCCIYIFFSLLIIFQHF